MDSSLVINLTILTINYYNCNKFVLFPCVDFTPPMTPETESQMDCDEIYSDNSAAPIPSKTLQPEILSRKHKRQVSMDTNYSQVRPKRRLFLRTDPISDKALLDISHVACSKYIELGVCLDLSYNEIQSITGGIGSSKPEHLKAFYILQEWKGRAGFEFTFGGLSKALETVGLTSAAQQYCYEDDY